MPQKKKNGCIDTKHMGHGSLINSKFSQLILNVSFHLDKYFAKKTLVDITRIDLAVSKNRGYPQIIDFNRVFHFKPSILGYSYFRKRDQCLGGEVQPRDSKRGTTRCGVVLTKQLTNDLTK